MIDGQNSVSRGSKNITPIFLVGCGRSGTTLVQSYVGAHPDVMTFPETNFIGHVFGDHMQRLFGVPPDLARLRTYARMVRIWLGYANRSPRRNLLATLENIGRADLMDRMPTRPLRIRRAIRIWADTLDEACNDAEKLVWLEKTPMHVAYIEEILRVRPAARILHIIREPSAVIASMLDAARKYPEWTKYTDIHYCLSVWNRSIEFSNSVRHKENQFFVRYEDFVCAPDQALSSIYSFAGLRPADFDEVEKSRRDAAAQISLSSEPWITKAFGKLQVEDKAMELLSETELAFIKNNAATPCQPSWRPIGDYSAQRLV